MLGGLRTVRWLHPFDALVSVTNVFQKSVNFPSDFDEATMEREAAITKWCLDHEPSKRPTADQLLKVGTGAWYY